MNASQQLEGSIGLNCLAAKCKALNHTVSAARSGSGAAAQPPPRRRAPNRPPRPPHPRAPRLPPQRGRRARRPRPPRRRPLPRGEPGLAPRDLRLQGFALRSLLLGIGGKPSMAKDSGARVLVLLLVCCSPFWCIVTVLLRLRLADGRRQQQKSVGNLLLPFFSRSRSQYVFSVPSFFWRRRIAKERLCCYPGLSIRGCGESRR